MLRFRLLTGLTLIAALLIGLNLDERCAPWFPFWFLATGTALTLAALELHHMLSVTSIAPSRNAVLGGCWAILLANWAPHVLDWMVGDDSSFRPLQPILAMAWPVWTFAFVVLASFVAQAIQFDGQSTGQSVGKLAGTIFVLTYAGILGSFVIQMRWLEGANHGLVPLLMLVATAKGADTGAYTVGRICGRNKLWPALSPNKTIEGAIGGMVFGVLAALLVAYVGQKWMHDFPFAWAKTLGFGVLVALVAQMGDLMESMIKRDCETKDASSTLPGFGGVLDVIDSILFASPVAFAYWLVFWP